MKSLIVLTWIALFLFSGCNTQTKEDYESLKKEVEMKKDIGDRNKETTKIEIPNNPESIPNKGCSNRGISKTIIPKIPERKNTTIAHNFLSNPISFKIINKTTTIKIHPMNG